MQCFEEDFEACIAHLQLPPNHRRSVRTTNLLERLFVEERRRVRAMLHSFGERPVLKLMYAALIRGSERWKNTRITEFERRQLERLRAELQERHTQRHSSAVKAPRTGRTRPGEQR